MNTDDDNVQTASTGQIPYDRGSSSLIGALTAGGRSIVYQMTSFYLRTPVKLFRPPRFDYLHYVRIVLTGEENQRGLPNGSSSYRTSRSKYFNYWENSSLGILTKALNKYGWKVIPDRILPPLIVNSATGVVLYTTYLTSFNHFSSRSTYTSSAKNPWDVWRSGFIAGAMQALVSTPIDAIYARSSTSEFLSVAKKYDNLWIYGLDKLKEIGMIGCFGGFGLAFIKESLGFAVYFTTFEIMKGQVCTWFKNMVRQYAEVKYVIHNTKLIDLIPSTSPSPPREQTKMEFLSKKEEKWLNRAFIFVGGVTAAFLLQVVQYPFKKIQKIHQSRLEAFDIVSRSLNYQPLTASSISKATKIWVSEPASRRLHIYYNSYLDTFEHVRFIHKNTNSMLRWLYKGFTRNTLAIIPGTTAGLLMLDYMRSSFEQSLPQMND
ncbi:hypothetical protein HG537_0H03360 [Torulaspora globosa]|uniref:Mitochondrial carrier n=1 Tax=Torulaspora globosa TaxID=48254 RepID=A0A7H9HZB2_9SACH|nr:hypothetical protein HG537_0H03360 [Torulaspora sp. CBS 2947]